MHLPSALDARESVLCLYRSKSERMHAAVHFLLSGLERDERLLTIFDTGTEDAIWSLLSHLGAGDDSSRYRRLSAESFVEQAPVDPESAVALIRRAASGWHGRPSRRPVRVAVDLHYLLVSLGSDRGIPALSSQLSDLTAELPVILLCVLFVEHIPRRGLGAFLRGFSRICASESLVAGSPPVSAGNAGTAGDNSDELDAVLNRLVLSDEVVLERIVASGRARDTGIEARAFLHVAADPILILDRELTVEYASPSLAARFREGQRCRRGAPLATCLSGAGYRQAEDAFRTLASESLSGNRPLFAIITLTFAGVEADRVFEASVAPLLACGRDRGYVCLLREVGETERAGDTERAGYTPPGTAAKRASIRPPSAEATGRVASYGARAWRELPRRVVDGRSITPREVEILELTLNGSTAREIAEHLAIAPVTVKKHRSNGYRKLGIHNRFELYSLADTGR
ncbi:MAG: LuxR C-terminal-related transcriptional regulator [Spirochaetia bacterium]